MQRSIDIFLSFFALVILAPVFIFVGIALRLTGEGKIFYRQNRVGLRGETFKLIKFATMLENSPNIGARTLTLKNDPRVLPLGRILRKTKINELPQILNVLIGDMAIVGPRPLVIEGELVYSPEVREKIRSVRPGLTGLGSLLLRDEEALYGERQDAHQFYVNSIQPFKAKIELWYIENHTLILDLKIIILTALVIVFPNFNVSNYLGISVKLED